VRLNQCGSESGKAGKILAIDDELVGIGAAIGPNSHGFSAVNELRAALAEALPPAHNVVGNASARGPVPPFHRLNGVTVSDLLAVNSDGIDWMGKRRVWTCDDGIIAREIDSKGSGVSAEIGGGSQGWNSDELAGLGHRGIRLERDWRKNQSKFL
jgi:hypothetical protein